MDKVTVLCTVFNGSKYFDRAIPSILDQTYSNFEFLIINDGSEDDTMEKLTLWEQKDTRIRVINCERMGRVKALNFGVKIAKTSLIANQDFDDISYPTRLENQVSFMQINEDIAWCGTAGIVVKENRNGEIFTNHFPLDHKSILSTMAHSIPFDHTTVIYRREAVLDVGGYPDFGGIEDFRLSILLAKKGYKIANLPQVLGEHLEHSESYWNTNLKYRQRQMALQKAQFEAIRDLNLPLWTNIYPLGRYFYYWLPNSLKTRIRKLIQ